MMRIVRTSLILALAILRFAPVCAWAETPDALVGSHSVDAVVEEGADRLQTPVVVTENGGVIAPKAPEGSVTPIYLPSLEKTETKIRKIDMKKGKE